GLEALWRRYQPRGLVVLGVPSNDFGEQEPGTASEIKQFCSTNYQVDFPLTEKYRVVGGAAHPFYRWVAAQLGEAGAPRWNFHKYLVGPAGELAGAWPSQVKPTDTLITAEIEGMLPPAEAVPARADQRRQAPAGPGRGRRPRSQAAPACRGFRSP